jgi:hypothetical protein
VSASTDDAYASITLAPHTICSAANVRTMISGDRSLCRRSLNCPLQLRETRKTLIIIRRYKKKKVKTIIITAEV